MQRKRRARAVEALSRGGAPVAWPRTGRG